MKILRSVSRRGFSVGTAGWFTVLRPNTWFPASRFPATSRGAGAQAIGSARLVRGEGVATGAMKEIAWPGMERRPEDSDRVRLASIIVGAVAITSALLWWIMHP